MANFVNLVLGKHAVVVELGPDNFAKLKARMTWGATRTKNTIIWIRGIFNWADQERLIPRPPHYGQSFSVPQAKTVRKARRQRGKKLYTAAQIKALIAKADDVFAAMLYLGINAGFGNTDCAELPASAIDLDAALIDFPRPKTEVDRQVPLWPETVAALRKALAARPKPASKAFTPLAFLSKRGNLTVSLSVTVDDKGKPVAHRVDTIATWFAETAVAAEVPNLGFYALRHTFRTIADECNSPYAVNRICGHELAGMSAFYNEHVQISKLKQVTDYVQAWFNRSSESDSSGDASAGPVAPPAPPSAPG